MSSLLVSLTFSCAEQDDSVVAPDSADERSDIIAKKWNCTSECQISDYTPEWDETNRSITNRLRDPICSPSKAKALEAISKLEFACETSGENRWADALYSCTRTSENCDYKPEAPLIGPREFNCELKCQIQHYEPEWDESSYRITATSEYVSCSDRITGAWSDAEQLGFVCETSRENRWAKTLLECGDTGNLCSK